MLLGAFFRKEIQQTLSLSLNSKLIDPQTRKLEFLAPEQQV